MSTHLSDEEQLESLKRWWRENGMQLVLVVVLGVGGWFGWNTWQDNREARSQAASLAFANLIALAGESEQPDADRLATLHSAADSLREDFSGSPYAAYTALLQARLAVDAGDYDAAAAYLRMVLDGKPDQATGLIARLRLARVLGAQGAVDDALALLDGVDAKQFSAQYAEVRGDLHLMAGDVDGAMAAYRDALDRSAPGEESPLLELKLSQLSPTAVPLPGLELDSDMTSNHEVDDL